MQEKWENISENTHENTESRLKTLARGPKGRHPIHRPNRPVPLRS